LNQKTGRNKPLFLG